ncbi:MAG TPA: pyridoxamine 5'-phosphate oxidase family protein [Microbacteriaceae bacterium]|nr:pyridoxamine 5'-phosphate oxidase family protein [Microbacteriaceae bacterium]
MSLTPGELQFIADHHTAAIITVDENAVPKPVRIDYAIIDGKIWSSGTQTRVRTRRLRKDPSATLFIWDPVFDFLSVRTTVTILDGPDAPELNLRYFRVLKGTPEGPLTWMGKGEFDDDGFRAQMVADQRLIYQFEPISAYGNREF